MLSVRGNGYDARDNDATRAITRHDGSSTVLKWKLGRLGVLCSEHVAIVFGLVGEFSIRKREKQNVTYISELRISGRLTGDWRLLSL
jgi:hypothetical protein